MMTAQLESQTKLAFVIPWYGPEIPGGAETLCREWVERLALAGHPVEILTTTIERFQSNWNHAFHSPGCYLENGVTVRRFALKPGDHSAFGRINSKLLSYQPISPPEEETFMRESANSNTLLEFIQENRKGYLFFFIPYLFGTTFFGVRAARDRAVLIPCLHDEPYAHMTCMKECFANTRAFMFNSNPERELAERLFPVVTGSPKIVLGLGLDSLTCGNPDAFRSQFNIHQPFILYAGRKDRTKNTDLLMLYFRQFKESHPDSDLQLVLIGPGTAPRKLLRPDIKDLGFVSREDKYNAYAAAELFCNPSVNESFSIVLMESWHCGTPVLVNSRCPVTADYVLQSQGGLLFSDYFEFEAGLEALLKQPQFSVLLAEKGSRFVRSHFSWESLLSRFSEWVKGLLESD